MKTIRNVIILLCSLPLFFACTNEGEEIIPVTPPGKATPVSLKLSADVGTPDTKTGVDTKAIAPDFYTAEAIYLMVENGTGPDGWEAYPMLLQKTENWAGFDIYISTTADGEVSVHNGSAAPVNFVPDTRLFFSSTQDITITTGIDDNKLAPDGNPTLKPYGENLFRSEIFSITPITNGVSLLGHSFIEGQDIGFILDMFRQTAMLEVNLALYRRTQENPLVVSPGHFNPDITPPEDWRITTYLNGYTSTFRMDEQAIDPPATGVYMLSNGAVPFTEREKVDAVVNGQTFNLHWTHGAYMDDAPYIFSGPLAGATLEFQIVNTQHNESEIASVILDGEILKFNEIHTIYVFMNIAVLEDKYSGRNLRATLLTGDEEVLPDIFYCWD